MSDKEKAILKTFGEVIPDLSEEDKEKLIIYGQGYADGKRSRQKSEAAKAAG